jgi:hypothetical protein
MAMLRNLAVLGAAAEVARRYAKKNPEKVNQMAEQAARFIDQRTNGKYRQLIDSTLHKVRQVNGGNQPGEQPPTGAQAPTSGAQPRTSTPPPSTSPPA